MNRRKARLTKSIIDKGSPRKARKTVLTTKGKVVVGTAAIAAAAAIGGGVALHSYMQPAKVARRAEAPAMVEVARAGNFHQYDRMAVEKKFRGASQETILRHWDKISEIAGTNYNTLAVLDTLSRAPRSLNNLSSEIGEQQAAGTARAQRKIDILRRVQSMGVKDRAGTETMLNDLFDVRSRDVETVRHTYYGKTKGNWMHGNIVSGSQTNLTSKANQFKRLDKKSEKMKAKARN